MVSVVDGVQPIEFRRDKEWSRLCEDGGGLCRVLGVVEIEMELD